MTTCPKCGYVRKPSDTVPDWECPSCNIAYAKFHATPPAARSHGPGGAARANRENGKHYESTTVHLLLLGAALFFTGFVSLMVREWVSYEHYGLISGPDLGRVILVSLDLYFAGSALNSLLDQIKRPISETHHRLKFAAGCVAVAFTLHFTGVLTKVYTSIGLTPPGPIASIGMLKATSLYAQAPNLPLEDFAGDWVGVAHRRMPQDFARGTNTISRVHVSVANGEARVRIWRSCTQQECDGGTFPAIIESRSRGTAVGLHVTGTMNGTDWLMTLSTQPGHMMLEEQQIRGSDTNTRHQFFDWMSRPGDVRLK